MELRLAAPGLALALLVACRAPATPTPTRVAARPSPTPTATPTAVASAEPTVEVQGQMAVDVAYLQAIGAAIISTNAAGIIPTGGGLFVDASGRIVAQGGGNIIPTGGGNIIPTGGGNVIPTGGGNLGAYAAKLVGPYAALAADGLVPPQGTLGTVEGMQVQASSLATGQPLGAAVRTDATGHFVLQVPAKERYNVLVTARTAREDARLSYALLVHPGPAAAVGYGLDEDSSLGTLFIRTMLVKRCLQAISDPNDPDVLPTQVEDLDVPQLETLLADLTRRFHDAAVAAGVPAKPLAERRRLAGRMVDATIARLDLGALLTDDSLLTYKVPQQPVLTALAGVMVDVRAAAAKPPEAFTASAYLGAAGADVRRPADVARLVVERYLALDTKAQRNALSAFVVGELGVPLARYHLLVAAGNGLMLNLGAALLEDRDGIASAAVAELSRP